MSRRNEKRLVRELALSAGAGRYVAALALMDTAAVELDADDFTDAGLGELYVTVVDRIGERIDGRPLSPRTLRAELRRAGRRDLAALLDEVLLTPETGGWARRVRRAARRRSRELEVAE